MHIAHGLGASVACAAIFYLAGLLLMPQRWHHRVSAGLAPGLIGAAIYVVICWFGVRFDIPVARAAISFASVVVLVACVQYRRIRTVVNERRLLSDAAWQSLAGFSLLYIVAYLFTRPPASSEFLPVAWTGNLDLLTYVRYTRYLLSLGPSNLGEYSYLNYVYLQTPGLFYILGALSLFFDQDPLIAAMPAQFALVALIGSVAAGISRSVFHLSARAALAIACVFISGSFFRYVASHYFLSTLMATPILLFLVWTTVEVRARRLVDVALGIQFAAAYILLLFVYPFLLFAGIGLQVGAILFLLLAELQHREDRVAPRAAFLAAGRTLLTALAVFSVLGMCFWPRMTWSIDMIVSLSRRGVAGWPLDLISPQAMFAWPGTTAAMQVAAEFQKWAIAAFAGMSALIAAVYFWWFRRETTAAQSACAGLLSAAIILYCVYFSLQGRSYQQWKFASYCVLPLSFVLYAGVLQLLWRSPLLARLAESSSERRLLTALPAFVAVALIGGNIAGHAAFDPALRRIPAAFQRISEIDKLQQFREITVQVNDRVDPFPPWLALYYLPHKKVHMVSAVFRPSEPLSLELVSRHRPLLVHNFGCQGVGHDDTMSIRGVGCLLFAPPTLTMGVTYPFNRTFLFLTYDGMTRRQPDGRWTTRPTVPLTLIADPEKAGLTGNMYLNLFVSPSVPVGEESQRLMFRLGDRRGESTLASQDWISLPVRSADWSGNRVWELPVFLDFPDGRKALLHELSLTEAPRGRLVELGVADALGDDIGSKLANDAGRGAP